MQHNSIIRFVAAASGTALIGALACSSDSATGPSSSTSRIAFTTSASAASASMVPITSGGHTLDLTAVRLTISRAELKRTHGDDCPGDDDQDDDHPSAAPSTESCGELKVGPFTVDLPLSGSL